MLCFSYPGHFKDTHFFNRLKNNHDNTIMLDDNAIMWDDNAIMWANKVYDEIIVKPVLNCHSQTDGKMVNKTNYRLMQVRCIAECSKGSILQFFRPSLSYHLSLRSLFCLFLKGRLGQVLLYSLWLMYYATFQE